MPELPEVEVVREGLAQFVEGRRIDAVRVLDARALKRHDGGPDDFVGSLVGRRCDEPRRRGKYLWIPLDGRDALIAHLGMSGQFRVDAPGAPLPRHARVVITMDDGTQLRFVDQRLFGSLAYCPGGAGLPEPIRHIALDPFDPHFRVEAVAGRLQAKHTTVKRALLDQTLVSGIGNIYADEALWLAHTNYEHPTSLLSPRRARAVLRRAADVMRRALAAGGTSFDALYVNVHGDSGYFARGLAVYGRDGQPCPRCGTAIVRQRFMNRSSYLCPRCQRLPRRLEQSEPARARASSSAHDAPER